MRTKTTFTIAALAAVLAAGSVRADDAKPAAAPAAPTARESVMTFFKHLKQALALSARADQRRNDRGAAVAAVRGGDQTSVAADPNQPAIKGGAAAAKAAKQRLEDKELESDLDLLLNGKTDEGVKALEAFKTKHPKSHNMASVQDAIDKAKSLSADKPSAAPAAN
jgi:hypothetical protein